MNLSFVLRRPKATQRPIKTLIAAITLALCSIAATYFAPLLLAADPATPGWKGVREAINKGLPKTAIERLEPIIAAAQNAKRYDEAVRAISMKIALEGNIQGNKPEEKITRMRAEIDAAPDEMKPVMNAIIANWYWHYFQNNRWRFMQRTQTSAPPSDDFTTWDLPRILAAIDAEFQVALAEAETLKKIPVADFDDLLDRQNAPDEYRPTMFDFLAHNALEFYTSAEQAGAKSQDEFALSADSPVFSSADDFLAWTPQTTDDDSPTLRAIGLYQELLKFHADDQDQSAFIDVDLARLVFGNNRAFGEEKTARFKAALRRFADNHASHVISGRALHHLASAIHGEGDFVKAHEIATMGLNRFPNSIGSNRCYNLIQQIEAREGSVATERVWNNPRPTIDVTYRNITEFHFRLVEFDYEAFLRSNKYSPESLERNERRAILSRQSVRSWSVDLPATKDYKQRVESFPIPDDLPKGSYLLIASQNDQFNENDNIISFTQLWVSDLALVTRAHYQDGRMDGFVLDAESGTPIVGAKVRLWHRERNQRVELTPVTTDKDGRFDLRSDNHRQCMVLVSKDGDQLATSNYVNTYRNPRTRNSQQTRFFTDRSIYRPGQTIHYKGICIDVNQQNDNYKTIPNRQLIVVFMDVNGKEIEQREHRTNDYGSFSGSVTAPRDRLMGRMFLRVKGAPRGQAYFRVEEYKRPKFRVSLDAPEIAPKLNDTVKLQGKATAYTGAAINDAKVSWRVVRSVSYPAWWYRRCWWMPPTRGGDQEIAHGAATTKSNGAFDVQFVAKPDESTPIESEPTFRYTIYADVTDTTGETRSSQRTIAVGYTALRATLAKDSWLTDNEPVELRVRTTTLDGVAQAAEGTLKVHTLVQPDKVTRAPLQRRYYGYRGYANPPKPDPSNPNSWEIGGVVVEQPFKTDDNGAITVPVKLAAGMYRAVLTTRDRFGKAVTAESQIQVLDPEANKLNLRLPNLFATKSSSLQPGDKSLTIWGSGYDEARAFVEIIHRGRTLESYWTDPGTTQIAIEQEVDESMRGGFNVRVTMVRENRAYMNSRQISVPWKNKELNIKWEHFVSKLEPAAKEKWTATISGQDAELAAAEMVATLYDASLDAYARHYWQSQFNVFRNDYLSVNTLFANQPKGLQQLWHDWHVSSRNGSLRYRDFPDEITRNLRGYGFRGRANLSMGMEMEGMAMDAAMPAPAAQASRMKKSADKVNTKKLKEESGDPNVDLDNVSARKNLNETAFFFPHLVSNDDGTVTLEFTMPEALTEWRFIGFAHDQNLRGGLLSGTTVTAKDLMVQPNPPRFLREGDTVEFTVKVSNQSETQQTGSVRLSFSDARTGENVDARLQNDNRDQSFVIAAGESKSLAWRISVPDEIGFLTYKAVGSTGKLSDGEEGYLPVLSRRILVTESLPLPIRGKQTKEFEFTRLMESANSDTLKNQSLTVQMVSNPSWYAVMALPYLMQYPHECTEQTFNRLYANALARHIAGSGPKIHRVFEQWRGTPALDSPMEKNEELKAVLLEETPWVRQAESESQARRNVGILFDDNRLNDETKRLIRRMSEMQYDNGAWPWFPGGRENDYITLYIATGFGRMRNLGVDIDPAAAIKSLGYLDNWMTERYNRIRPADRNKNHLSTTIAFYLYGRSFFLKDKPVAANNREAVNYWLAQAQTYWLQLAHRQSQAHLAVALKRFGKEQPAQSIMRSIKERSVSDEEMGMFWRELELSWWWYRAPIETQAMMIEAFDEVMNDAQAVEDCKVWLLKQKQTQDWKTTKATADAVYALLLRGSDMLASDALVDVSLGGQVIKPTDVEAGTGFYEQRFAGGEIKPEQGKIKLTKIDEGVAWGSVHWQYLEDISKVTPYEGTPLKLTKQLHVKKNTDKGPTLVPVNGPVNVGDELVVRVVLRTDRDMEYVHLKDYRGSGTEPVNVLSRYKFQDGLGYYESTRDTASHFFIDYLPKGVYVFEYSTRVQLKGNYQTGVASIQCMYAPEFNSHSASLPIEVK